LSVVLLGSIQLSHSKTIDAKVISFLSLRAKRSSVIKKLYNFDAWWTA